MQTTICLRKLQKNWIKGSYEDIKQHLEEFNLQSEKDEEIFQILKEDFEKNFEQKISLDLIKAVIIL